MSLINDALNKAQRERAQPRGATLYRTPGYRPPFQPPVRVKSLGFIWANVALAAVLCLAGIWYLRFRPATAHADTSAEATTAASPPAQKVAPLSEPVREPPALTPLPPPAPLVPAAGYELTGMSALGSTTLLSIVRQSDKRSFWIPVGKTVGEITAVSYDATTDHAVIQVNGRRQTIALRDVGASANAPAASPAE